MTQLPSGWQQVAVADVCAKVHKQDPLAQGRERIRYVDIGSVDGAKHQLMDVAEIPATTAPTRARQVIAAGDTVFSTVRPNLQKIAFIGDALDGEFASTGFCVLRPTARVHPRWLFHLATSHVVLDQVLPLQRGVSYPAVRDKDVLSSLIPLPPFEEQRRIVDVLEDQLSRLDAAERQTESANRRAHAWQRAYADELFWGGEDPTFELGDLLASPMRNGHSARASTSGHGIRTLTLTAVTRGRFTDDFTKVTTADPKRVADLWLRSGDILVQRSNTPELVGTTELYTGPDDWAIFPDLLIRCRVDTARVLPAFAAGAMRTERAHRWLRARAKGLAGSMPKIDQGTIAALRIPVPAIRNQVATVARLAELNASTARLAGSCTLVTARGKGLRRSLLEAAFTGRLTRSTLDVQQLETVRV